MFPNARLQKHIANTSYYEIPREEVDLATLFEQFEINKERLGLDDWGISETSCVFVFVFCLVVCLGKLSMYICVAVLDGRKEDVFSNMW